MDKMFKFPLKMHVGAPCEPVVKEEEKVQRGQCIAEPTKGLGAKIHASVTGIVSKVTESEIIIKADENQSNDYLKIKQCDSIIDSVFEAGIVGAGGAGFPAHVKLKAEIADGYIVANCVECEPLLKHNIKLLEENPEMVIKGIRYAMEATKAPKGYMGIKSKNKKAIDSVKKALNGATDIEVKELQDLYPMGEERALIHAILGQWLRPDQLPLEAKCVVLNTETLANITRAVENRKPVIDKDFSVAGKLKSGKETTVFFQVPVGTQVCELVEKAGGIDGAFGEVVIGGPYTGKADNLENATVTKISGGAIVTIELPEFTGKLGLLVCACGASEERLKDVASKMNAEVVGSVECKNIEHIKNASKCKTPGD
ncbi:proline reductase-associated electron transfer protein PrdC [Clostridium frigidicarnis]|uniref:Proline reductase-associated electron transfer protein PrdC n=2 Tax=Clostridium frigidicarnis TaxID=84698 RepID=A0A1I1AWY7_9CLOT|nr:proline reductase-associated electron transfer protein PrdC [Clostridium frigidicarnis]